MYESGIVPFVVAERKVDGVPTVIVDDGRKALANACRNFFGKPDEELQKIAVTGTNGKTTVSYIIDAILREAGFKPVLVGTTGVVFGDTLVDLDSTTPSTYEFFKVLRQAVDAGVDSLVMEVSSHALHQHRINGVVFDVGIFTNLSGDHLDYHKSMEEYFEAKKILFTSEYTNVGVIGIDNDYGLQLFKEAEIDKISYGLTPKAELTAKEIWFGLDGLKAMLVCPAGVIEAKSPLVGLHNFQNIMAATAGCIMLGVDNEHIKQGIANLKKYPGTSGKIRAFKRGIYICRLRTHGRCTAECA